ncbi:hypothetical protein GQX74_009725 [Glossina fuscipes]|nr:hypothetical protein GQX74_009725 [Glossina fuscipes]
MSWSLRRDICRFNDFEIADILYSFSAWKAFDAHLYIGTHNELLRTFPKSKIDDCDDFRTASVRKNNNNLLILSLQLYHHNIVVGVCQTKSDNPANLSGTIDTDKNSVLSMCQSIKLFCILLHVIPL